MLKIVAALVVAAWMSWTWDGSVYAQAFKPSINPNASPIVVSQSPEMIIARPKVTSQTLFSMAFGATANGGNTKSYAGNLGGRFALIRDPHQLMIEALGTLGGSRQGKLTEVEWNSQNVIARIRYDLFLSQFDAVFVAVAPRHDKFAGLKLRLQNQVGYLRNLYYPSDAHRVWTELGYDLTYDNVVAIEGAPPPPPKVGMDDEDLPLVHSARVFLGYTNRLSPTANLSLGVESLLDFMRPENVRVNGLAELTSSITHSFKLGLQSRILYDREPVLGAEKYDVIAAAQLVYTFDSLAGTVTTVCPTCDCTAQVQAARAACSTREPPGQITR